LNVTMFRNWEFSGFTEEEAATLINAFSTHAAKVEDSTLRSSGNRLAAALMDPVSRWFIVPEGSSRYNFIVGAQDLLCESAIGRDILNQLLPKE